MTRPFLPESTAVQDGQDRSGPLGARSSLPRKRPESFRRPHPSQSSKPTARKAHGDAGQDAGRSECRPVMGRIRDKVPGPKGSPRPAGALSRESLKNRLDEGRRKTAVRAGAPSSLSWSTIDWRRVNQEVWRLQTRIAKAVRERRWGKVKSLQNLLIRSRAAKLWAMKIRSAAHPFDPKYRNYFRRRPRAPRSIILGATT